MKILKFSEGLPEKIIDGKKTSTRRVNDKRGIVTGDELSLCHNDGTEFAKAIVVQTNETTFSNLTENDREGHEKFVSEEKIYKTYSGYYGFDVGPTTNVKIIKFKILEILN